MNKNGRVLLTHFDLDGVSCDILLSKMFKFQKKYQCGYGKVIEHFEKGDFSGYESAIVSDICLTEGQYKKLLHEYNNKLLVIDHHPESKKIANIYDNRFSATALIFKNFYKQLKKIEGINNFVAAVDAYDLWRHKTHPDMFEVGYDLNTLFWVYGYWNFYDRFFESCSLKYDKTEQYILDKHNKERDKAIKDSDINEFGNNSVFVLDTKTKYVNDYTLQLPQYDVYFMLIIIEDVIKLSCRSSLENVSLGKILESIENTYWCVKSAGGHNQAGGVDFKKDTSMDDIFDVVEYINHRMEPYDPDLVPF